MKTLTKQVSAEARACAKAEIQEHIANYMTPDRGYDDTGKAVQALLDKSRATLPSAGDGKDCIVCPHEVRGLYAVAFNLLNLFMPGAESRRARKLDERLAELRLAVDKLTPLVETHFANHPSPPPPQPAADDEQQRLADEFYFTGSEPNETSTQAEWTAEQQCHRALSSLYLAVDKSIADDMKKHVMARIEELERTAGHLTQLLSIALAREAKLTAAIEAKDTAIREFVEGYSNGKAGYFVMKARLCDALALKPASVLTATKKEGR